MKKHVLALTAAMLIPFTVSSAQLVFSSAGVTRGPGNVLSIQPLNAMTLTMYSAEYERRTGSAVTLGVGGTHWSLGDDDLVYSSGDVKLRYYPQGTALQGFSLGGSVGFTSVSASSPFDDSHQSTSGATFGVLLEHQWLMGVSRNFALGLGVGGKALMIDED